MTLKDRPPERKLSNKQSIVIKFVDTSLQNKSFWSREMKLCSKLTELYGEEFLLWVTPPNFKANSLAAYLGDWGKKFLSKQLFEYKKSFDLPETAIIKTDIPKGEKIGEDILLQKKPKTLQDFLKLYE